MRGQQRILGVAAVKAPSHTAHKRGGLLTFFKTAVGRVGDLSDALYAGNYRLLYVIIAYLKFTKYRFGVVHTKRFHPNEYPARLNLGYSDIGKDNVFALCRLVKHNRFHVDMHRHAVPGGFAVKAAWSPHHVLAVCCYSTHMAFTLFIFFTSFCSLSEKLSVLVSPALRVGSIKISVCTLCNGRTAPAPRLKPAP